MKAGIYSFMLGVFVAGMAQGQTPPDPNDPEVLLRNRLSAVVKVLENSEMDLATKEIRINRLVQPLFDFELMSYLTLGKRQWLRMSSLQRKRFLELFVARLKASYRDKLTLYSGERIVYKTARRSGTRIQIPTELVTQEKSTSILYKMHEKKNRGWRIYDVEVQGVSLITTYRVQFKEVLSQGSIESLLQKLKQPEAKEVSAQP